MTKDIDHLKMIKGTPKQAVQLPPLVVQVRDNALLVLSNSLEELFASCDDLFFDLSSRAASNNEQNLYFESMRELRVKKHGVINAFRQQLENRFARLTSARPLDPNTDSSQPESLSLVQNDDLEQEVAINSMTGKARANCQEALYHLTSRFDYLIPAGKVDADNNPLDPQQLCQSFAQACELFEINIKARIIIFKQFERHVVSKFANIYAAANNLLIDAGVLPKISHQLNKQSNPQPTQPASETAQPGQDSDYDRDVAGKVFNFLEISQLLSSLRQLGALSQLPHYSRFSSNPGPTMESNELLELLNQIQPRVASASPAQRFDLRDLIDKLLAKQDPETPQSLHQPDEDLINLVAMFFDFVLDDQAVPVAIQALIARLQIPILKTALKDHSFFSQGNHPARKLVNFIAASSIGWEAAEPDKDEYYQKISAIVQLINKQYTSNDNIFAEQLEALRGFVEKQQRKSSLVEKRTSQAIEGKAKTEQAKRVTQKVMFDKLEKQQLPPVISEFLVQQWQQLLIIIHLKEGEDSTHWLQSVQLIDDLIWASHQHLDPKSIERLEKLKPGLLDRIAEGLAQVCKTDQESDDLIRAINDCMTAIQLGDDAIPQLYLSADQAVALGHTPGSGSKNWQEMTAMERQQAKYQALTYDFIKKVENIPLNSWLHYQDSNSGKTVRCKLAARIDTTDSYVFVNRLGFKVLDKPRKEVAYDMQQGRVSLIEEGLLFDRAMSRIIDNLRQMGTASS